MDNETLEALKRIMAWTKEDNGQEIHDECHTVEDWISKQDKQIQCQKNST